MTSTRRESPRIRRVAVFAGSTMGARPQYRLTAEALGRALAARGVGLVYGGASVGLMGAVADEALGAGGEVIGVLPRGLFRREVAHRGLTELREVRSMHERKATMSDLADGFIALPGGLGTFDELFEMVTWAQIGLHAKPIGLLDVASYYQPLLRLVAHAVAEGFVPPANTALLLCDPEPEALVERLLRAEPTPVTRPASVELPER